MWSGTGAQPQPAGKIHQWPCMLYEACSFIPTLGGWVEVAQPPGASSQPAGGGLEPRTALGPCAASTRFPCSRIGPYTTPAQLGGGSTGPNPVHRTACTIHGTPTVSTASLDGKSFRENWTSVEKSLIYYLCPTIIQFSFRKQCGLFDFLSGHMLHIWRCVCLFAHVHILT